MNTEDQLMQQFARRFVQRRDDFAKQLLGGGYNPMHRPITVDDLYAHLRGEASYGHYLLDQDSQARVFSFDIDLVDGPGNWVQPADLSQIPEDAFTGPDADHWFANHSYLHEMRNVREAWRNKIQEPRPWLKSQMRKIVEMFTERIHSELGIGTAAAYSGNKGVHVYGFTGTLPAREVREAGELILASFDRFVPTKGGSVYGDTEENAFDHFRNFEIELFPKQVEISEGGYGNLMRLPLGRNFKSADPTFFLDQTTAHNDLTAASPEHAVQILETGNPWKDFA